MSMARAGHDVDTWFGRTGKRRGVEGKEELVANRHFAKAADVWKHLSLVEILSIERPTGYWESHAGSATYEMVEDRERAYGVPTFVHVAADHPSLARSRYMTHLRSSDWSDGQLVTYPASPMLAMLELGSTCSYVLCDLDPGSVADLRAAAERLDLAAQVRVVRSDGMTALRDELRAEGAGGAVLAHIDPYDPWAVGPGGLSALDLARALIGHGVGVVYWYGYDRPDRRRWAFDELSVGAHESVWCGDMLVTTPDGDAAPGDLGAATTPGTGFGIVCANVAPVAVEACQRLGEALAEAYDGVPLPDGRPGRLEFTTLSVSASDR
jgi:hypothetical protein